MKEEMIHNRLVYSIQDGALSESLQTDSKFTLETAKTKIRQKEAVYKQQQTLKGAEGATNPVGSVNAIGNKLPRARSNPRRRNEGQVPRKLQNREMCVYCGIERHPRDKCPAKDTQCHSCKHRGHCSAMCRQTTVSSMIEQDNPDSAFQLEYAIQRQQVCVDLQGQRQWQRDTFQA